jgi:hypothetical protein
MQQQIFQVSRLAFNLFKAVIYIVFMIALGTDLSYVQSLIETGIVTAAELAASPRIDFPSPSERPVPRFLCQLAACPGLDELKIHRISARPAFGTTSSVWQAAVATSLRALRPSRWAISPSATAALERRPCLFS